MLTGKATTGLIPLSHGPTEKPGRVLEKPGLAGALCNLVSESDLLKRKHDEAFPAEDDQDSRWRQTKIDEYTIIVNGKRTVMTMAQTPLRTDEPKSESSDLVREEQIIDLTEIDDNATHDSISDDEVEIVSECRVLTAEERLAQILEEINADSDVYVFLISAY
jgi:hypothetical protein